MNSPRKNKGASQPVELDGLLATLDEALARFPKDIAGLPPASIRRARTRLDSIASQLGAVAEKLDTVRTPASVFDPSNPSLVGRFIALTLIAQDRAPLSSIEGFYGAGVYAIYYGGPFRCYAPIAGTEHPIYVGKADPKSEAATRAMDQGTKLWGRLNEHRKNIAKATNLDIGDFECRFLVVASGWQKAAEDYLIQLFRPIWNNEMNLVFGLGKHGDAPETRGNKRSPWDTLHPGRPWARKSKEDQKSTSRIESELGRHFSDLRPYKSLEDIFSRFMKEMHQLPNISSTQIQSAQ